ncbi:MAG: hypothetical protein WAO50_11205, partial [Candidatus Nanopelagicales bacterium]
RRAEQRAQVQVRLLIEPSELADAQSVFDQVWPSGDGSTQLPRNLMRALVHAGGYCSAAYRDGQPIGAAFGVAGRHLQGGHWHEHLHSHMAGALEPYRNQHIGTALKLHQRVWAHDVGIDTIVWTFDPLVRRNARFNLIKLGVDVDGFEPNFYGEMDDGINSGDATDRLFAWWRLGSARIAAAMAGELSDLDVQELVAAGRDVREVELPEDIVAVRAADPAAGLQWRLKVRKDLQAAFADGYRIIGVADHGGYVLERTS